MTENFTMIKNILERFKTFKGCITFQPTTKNNIEEVNKNLRQSGFCSIPDEYCSFLLLTDGLSYNGIEFFGTQKHYREKKAYTFPDLTASTKHYEDYAFFNNKIILGRVSESLIFYNGNDKLYAVADRLTLRSRREFSSFSQLFYGFLQICDPDME